MSKKNDDDETGDLFGDDPKKESREEKARRLRDEGINRAANRSDAIKAMWQENAYRYVVELARKRPTLTSQEVQDYARVKDGFDVPPGADGRCWGRPLLRGAKEGVLRKYDVEPATDPKHHCAPTNRWFSLIYGK